MTDPLSADLASLRIQRDEPPRKGRLLRPILLVSAIAIVGALAVTAWPKAKSNWFPPEVEATEISSVSLTQASVELTATGYVIPQIVAKVGPQVSGRVARVHVREGAEVKAGQILFELDATEQKSQLATAQARAAAAHARVIAAKANLTETVIKRDREQKLASSGAVSQANADDLNARARALEEQVKAAEAEARAVESETGVLRVNMGRMVINAPISGTAITKPAEVGDIASSETTLVELADFNALLVEADVPEGKLSTVKIGAPCEVALDALPEKKLRAVVAEFGPKLNRAKATAIVKVRVEEGAEHLRPEMSARVSFLSKPIDPAERNKAPKIVVPSSAIVERNGGKFVYVIRDGHVQLAPITLGEPFGSGIEVKQGPPGGTRIVNKPSSELADGQAIKERSS